MKKSIVILIVFGLFISCNDLEEEVYSSFLSSNFYQNEAQLQSQNLGIYNTFKHVQWERYNYQFLSMPGQYSTTRLGSDVWWKAPIYGIHETQNASQLNSIWTLAYQAISRANTVIKYAPTSPLYENDLELVDQYIAEAKWLRAYTYFTLVQMFGDVPLYKEPVETPDNNVLYRSRTASEEIYELMVEDLKFAVEKLPVIWVNTPSGRVTKGAGNFLLGKIYLTMAGLPLQKTEHYQDAIDILLPIANNPGDFNLALLSDWKSVFDKDNEEGNQEIIFALSNTYESGYGGIMPFFTNPLKSSFGGGNGPNYSWAYDYELVNLYEDTDVRKQEGFTFSYVRTNNGATVNFNPNPTNPNGSAYAGRNGICGTKYLDVTGNGNNIHEKDVIIYRYVDTFLMLAEAYLETNNPSDALTYLNIARQRVNASIVTQTDQAVLRNIVRTERYMELYGEYQEVFDMRRWGTAKDVFLSHPVREWRASNTPWDDK